jgi:hypothetical protein
VDPVVRGPRGRRARRRHLQPTPVGGIVLAADRQTMIVSVPSQGKLVYFDTLAEKEIKQVEVDFQPTLLAVQGKRLFAAAQGAPKVFVLEPDTAKVLKEIALPGEPLYSMSRHPAGRPLFDADHHLLREPIGPRHPVSSVRAATEGLIVWSGDLAPRGIG